MKRDKPLVPGLLFIRADHQTASGLPVESRTKMVFLRNLESNQLLIVPDKQMEDFMFLLDFSESAVRIENESLRRGDRVRIIKGDFAGIEGELVRIKGHKRVVVRLDGLFSLATTYIPSAYLEKIE
jgi:transcription antitermination factor NusG